MAVVRKSSSGRAGKAALKSLGRSDIETARSGRLQEDAPDDMPDDDRHEGARAKRLRQGVAQFPMQILVPEETREALRQRSEDTGASIRHIILRSLAADGFPVPRLTRRRS